MTDSCHKSCENGSCSHYFQVTELIGSQPQTDLSCLFLPVQEEKLSDGTDFLFWALTVKNFLVRLQVPL